MQHFGYPGFSPFTSSLSPSCPLSNMDRQLLQFDKFVIELKIIKYLVVSWVLFCKAAWVNMRSFFPDACPFFLSRFWLIYFSVVLGGCNWKSDDMLCVCSSSCPSLHYSPPHYCSSLDLYTKGIWSGRNHILFTLACCFTVNLWVDYVHALMIWPHTFNISVVSGWCFYYNSCIQLR